MARKLRIAKDLFDIFYPIGSYYETSNASWTPQSAGWYGTWVEDTQGRVFVALDTTQTEFNTINKIGGSKYLQQHQHKDITWGKNGREYMYTGVDGSSEVFNLAGSGVYRSYYDKNSTNHIYTGNVDTDVYTGYSGNLQPYIVGRRWHRTA